VPQLSERFVFISGDPLSPQLTEFLDHARLPHVEKPFDLETLRAAVSNFEPIARGLHSTPKVPPA
jgi:hypothetical protein